MELSVKNAIKLVDGYSISDLQLKIFQVGLDDFQNILSKILAPESLEKIILDNNFTLNISEMREYFLQYIFKNMFNYRINNKLPFLKILVEQYNFIPSHELLVDTIPTMNTSVLEFLGKYIDLHKYMNEIAKLFNNICNDAYLKQLNKLLEMGFDIKHLSEIIDTGEYCDSIWFSMMKYGDPDILKILLDHGISFKKYELEILLSSVRNNCYEFLKILVEYGADLSILNQQTDHEENDINLYKLLAENNVDPMTIALLFRG